MDGVIVALAIAGLSAARLPGNVAVDGALRVIVERMLDSSASFRAQCREIARRPTVRVYLVLEPKGSARGRRRSRAETELRRYEHGAIVATTKFWSTRHAAELIAHEIEHVLEFADGVNFRGRAALPGSGVWMPMTGHFETERAASMGQQVAQEVAREGRK